MAGELLLAAGRGDVEEVTRLCALAPESIDHGGNGITALYLAAVRGYSEVVKVLIGLGARVDIAMRISMPTALIAAVANEHAEVVMILVAARVPLNTRSPWGWTALMVAAHDGLLEILTLLVKAGAELDHRVKPFGGVAENGSWIGDPEDGGRTGLMVAAARDHTSCVKLLLRSGADHAIVDQDGKTSLMLSADGATKALLEEVRLACRRSACMHTFKYYCCRLTRTISSGARTRFNKTRYGLGTFGLKGLSYKIVPLCAVHQKRKLDAQEARTIAVVGGNGPTHANKVVQHVVMRGLDKDVWRDMREEVLGWIG